jgi:hypothetical protein
MRPVALFLALLATACGTTSIVAGERDAAIYIDGELAGRGSVEITRRGIPRTLLVEVRASDGRHAMRTLSRGFSAATFVGGLLTYGIGFVTMWELPAEVTIGLPEATGDPWMQQPAW